MTSLGCDCTKIGQGVNAASFHGRHDYLDIEISLDHLPEIGSTKRIFLMLSVAVVWEELGTEYS